MLFIVEVLPIIGVDVAEMPVVLDITVAEDANVLLIGATGAGVVVLGALVILEVVTAPCMVPSADDDDKLTPMGVLDDPGVDGPDGAGVVNAFVVIACDVLMLAPAVLLEAAGVLVPTDTVLLEVAGDGVVEVPMALDDVSTSMDDDALMLLVEAAGASIDVLEGIGDVITPPVLLDDATVLLPTGPSVVVPAASSRIAAGQHTCSMIKKNRREMSEGCDTFSCVTKA